MCLCGSSVHGAWCMLPMLLGYLSKIYLESAINYDLKDRCEREKSIAAIIIMYSKSYVALHTYCKRR